MLCVSLFSGCGGLDIGVTNAGFNVVLANDNDVYCKESYVANNPDTLFYLGSICDLNEKALKKYIGSDINSIDLLNRFHNYYVYM